MKYEDIKGAKEYRHLFEEKNNQLKRFDMSAGYCIFIDGVKCTKYHNKDILSENGFTKHIFDTAKEIMEKYNIECYIFAILDEVSIIFPNSEKIENIFDVDCEELLLTKIISKFTLKFSKYDKCTFKGVIYKTSKGKENAINIINYRRLVGMGTSMEYFAKEFLEKEKYINKNSEELREVLKENELLEKYEEKKFLYEGYMCELKDDFENTLDFLGIN